MQLMRFASQFWKNEEGATAIEYGLLAALIAVAIIGAVSSLGGSVSDTFQKVNDEIRLKVPEVEEPG